MGTELLIIVNSAMEGCTYLGHFLVRLDSCSVEGSGDGDCGDGTGQD